MLLSLQPVASFMADTHCFRYELLMRESPYKDITDIFSLKKLVCDQKKRPKLPSSTPAGLVTLAKACWHPDPKKRPTFVEISEILGAMLQEHKQQAMWH